MATHADAAVSTAFPRALAAECDRLATLAREAAASMPMEPHDLAEQRLSANALRVLGAHCRFLAHRAESGNLVQDQQATIAHRALALLQAAQEPGQPFASLGQQRYLANLGVTRGDSVSMDDVLFELALVAVGDRWRVLRAKADEADSKRVDAQARAANAEAEIEGLTASAATAGARVDQLEAEVADLRRELARERELVGYLRELAGTDAEDVPPAPGGGRVSDRKERIATGVFRRPHANGGEKFESRRPGDKKPRLFDSLEEAVAWRESTISGAADDGEGTPEARDSGPSSLAAASADPRTKAA